MPTVPRLWRYVRIWILSVRTQAYGELVRNTYPKRYMRPNVDGVLGPVNRYFDETPPKWILKGKFYARATYPTGFVVDWRKGRTGNVLLKRNIFPADEL